VKLIEKNQADTQTNAACEAEKFPNPVDDIVPGWSIDPVTGERFFRLFRLFGETGSSMVPWSRSELAREKDAAKFPS